MGSWTVSLKIKNQEKFKITLWKLAKTQFDMMVGVYILQTCSFRLHDDMSYVGKREKN